MSDEDDGTPTVAPAATDGLDPASTAVSVFPRFANGTRNVVAELLPALPDDRRGAGGAFVP